MIALPEISEEGGSRTLSGSRLGAHVMVTMGTNVAQGGLAILTGVMLARLLGAVGRGELAAIQSWAPFIATVALLGLHEAVTFFSARHPRSSGRYWFSGMFLALLAGIPFAMLGYWLMPWLLGAQGPLVVSTARWYFLGLIVIFPLQWMPLASLRGRRDFAVWNMLQLLPSVGWVFVLLLAISFRAMTPHFVALCYVAMLGLILVPIAAVAGRRVPGPFYVDRHFLYPMIRYGLPLALATLPQWLWNSRIPQLFMAAFLEPRSLGLFTVAVSWGNMTGLLTHAVGVVLFPDVASRSTEADKGKALAQGVRLATLLTFGSSTTLFLLAPYGIPAVFGQEFAPAAPAAMVMALAAGIMGVKTVLDQGFRGLGKPGPILVAELIGLGVTATLLWVLLLPFNIIGAGIATLLGHGCTTVYLLIQARNATTLSVRHLLCPDPKEIMALWRGVRAVCQLALSR